MNIVLLGIFLLIGLLAAGFAVFPLLRARDEARLQRVLLAAAVVCVVLGIGLGSYIMLGSPGLALRALTGPRDDDFPALVAELSRRMREHPEDPRGWMLLAKGYQSLGDQADAAAAYQKGITAMVAELDRRLKAHPNDPEGWQRLIRAHAVLGRNDEAQAALAQARRALGADKAALAELDEEARALKLK